MTSPTATESRLYTWATLTRASNLPTVWSNVAAGIVWGLHCRDLSRPPHVHDVPARIAYPLHAIVNEAIVLIVAASLLYAGGMVLNDTADATIDAHERPHRPIPSGRASRRAAATIASVMLAAGLLALVPYRRSAWTLPLGALLTALIVLYDFTHTRWAGSVLLVPLCRACLAFLAVMVVGGGAWGPTPLALLYPAALFTYVLMISLLARHEVKAGIARHIGSLVAGIALLDAVLLVSIGQWPVAVFGAACFVAAAAMQRLIPGS